MQIIRKKRVGIAALALTLGLGVGAGTTALVLATTNPALVRSGQLGTLSWYTNNYAIGNAMSNMTSPWATVCDGTNVWITHKTASGTITQLDAASGTIIGSVAVGTNPLGVAFDGANVWVANSGSNNVTKLAAANGALVGTYAVGRSPLGITFEQGGYSTSFVPNYDPKTYVWVTNNVGNTLSRLDAATGATVATYPAGAGPIWPCFDGSNVWVPNGASNTVTKIAIR